MDHSNNSGKIMGALLVGAAIGGALGILFAPDKGSETRKKIIGGTDELTSSLKDQFNEFLEKAGKELETARKKASEYAENFTGK